MYRLNIVPLVHDKSDNSVYIALGYSIMKKSYGTITGYIDKRQNKNENFRRIWHNNTGTYPDPKWIKKHISSGSIITSFIIFDRIFALKNILSHSDPRYKWIHFRWIPIYYHNGDIIYKFPKKKNGKYNLLNGVYPALVDEKVKFNGVANIIL